MIKQCENCKYYIHFEGVCVNGGSKYCADFVDKDNTCAEWEE